MHLATMTLHYPMCVDVYELHVPQGAAVLYWCKGFVCTYSGESSDLVGSSGREVAAENWKENIYIIFTI